MQQDVVKRIKGKSLLLTYPHCDLAIDDMLERIKDKCVRQLWIIVYIIVCAEQHADGVPHRHCYLQMDNPISIGKKKMKMFDLQADNQSNWQIGHVFHPNIKICKSPKDGIRYVKKMGEFISDGICPYKDVLGTKEKNDLLKTKTLVELVDNGDVSLFKIPQLKKALDIYQNELLQCKRVIRDKKIFWFYGQTGTGKTKEAFRIAMEEYQEDYWVATINDSWFDGFKGQRCVIFDDIRSSTYKFANLLRLLDRYPLQVPIKGGFTEWCPECIIVTAPAEPRELYRNYQTNEPYEGIEQLERRITELREFRGDNGGSEENRAVTQWEQ